MSGNASEYAAPAADMLFAMTEVVGLDSVRALPGCEDANEELVRQILDEAGRFGADVLAPLNRIGDIQGARLENGIVRTPEGFADAYARFVAGGWNAVPSAAEFGGQNLPWLVAAAVSEIWNSANMAFALCPILTQSAVEVLTAHGTPELKALFLPRLVSGEWTGTMVLTEAQAGSDLARIRTRAVPDGRAWRVAGQKIFITWGDHDVAENIVHMVLARTPGAPEGIKGLSLFAVPKFVPDPDGRPGERNDLRALSLERKLGIHASPTAVMAFGENGGARGFLVGEENRGIEHMFVMMNNARLAIGLQGVACAERAYQRARAYARERVQSRAVGSADHAARPIERHPDVKRMLLFMKSRAEVGRLLVFFAAAHIDRAKRHPDPATRAHHLAVVELLTPVVKGWCTDAGIAAADAGIQVHGGMGYIEETGAAQHLRDARITAIYEGTNGIQALDLVGRKVGRDQARAALALIGEMGELRTRLAARAADPDFGAIAAHFEAAIAALDGATRWVAATWPREPEHVAAGASAYLRLFGIVAGGWLATRAALAAQGRLESGGDRRYADDFLRGKIVCAQFFSEQDMVLAPSLARTVIEGGRTIALANESAI
jgi:alkylation response protein AidB-like acyl-CoA dehydrogenase